MQEVLCKKQFSHHRRNMGLLILLVLFMTPHTSWQIFTMTRNSDLADIVYPSQAHSERGLAICQTNQACNILHRRYWFRMRIERLCRCPNRFECAMVWSDEPDNRTMSLGNRSQLKFCDNTADLPQCTARSSAIIVTVQKPEHSNEIPTTNHTTVVAKCNCPKHHYWRYHQLIDDKYSNRTTHTHTTYRCVKLRKCQENEFCGNIRSDYFFTFYQCSCPMHHLCLQKDHKIQNVTELLYKGPGYKAFCVRFQH